MGLERSQWFTTEKLHRIQSTKLRKIVETAYMDVPFYRMTYDQDMVQKIQQHGSTSIDCLPIFSKTDLSKIPLKQRTSSKVNPVQCLRRTTSGTSGEPFVILETKKSAAYWKALILRALWAYGVRPGDKVVRFLPRLGLQHIGFFWDNLFNLPSLRPAFIDLSDEVAANIQQIMKIRPHVLYIQPSSLVRLMNYLEEREMKLCFRKILTMGETLTQTLRRRFEDFFSAEVYDRYSTVEVGNIAWECPTHTAYHINVDSVVLEVVNAKTAGRGVTKGEAVVTCLYRYATPIIRYKTGDLVEVVDDECPCGRGLPLLKSVEGRIVDCIVRKDGELISPYAIASRLEHVNGVRRFKVLQDKNYSVEVFVVPSDDVDGEKLVNSVKAELSEILRDLDFRVKLVDKIVEQQGKKFKMVESLVER